MPDGLSSGHETQGEVSRGRGRALNLDPMAFGPSVVRSRSSPDQEVPLDLVPEGACGMTRAGTFSCEPVSGDEDFGTTPEGEMLGALPRGCALMARSVMLPDGKGAASTDAGVNRGRTGTAFWLRSFAPPLIFPRTKQAPLSKSSGLVSVVDRNIYLSEPAAYGMEKSVKGRCEKMEVSRMRMEELAMLVGTILREADALENAKATGSKAEAGKSAGEVVIQLQRRIP